MAFKLTRGRPKAMPQAHATTKITLSGADLAAIGKLMAAGRVLLQEDSPAVTPRLKAAMTRVGIPIPQGL